MKDKIIVGTLYCLVAGVAWGAQFPIAGSALKLIDPFYFTLLRYLAVSFVITKGDISVLSSTSGNLIPALLILTGVFGWVIYTIGGSNFNWSPLRYTTLSCILGTASALVIVVLATIAGYLKVPDVETVATIRWEMGYMIVISGVLAIFSWNAGNRALTPING